MSILLGAATEVDSSDTVYNFVLATHPAEFTWTGQMRDFNADDIYKLRSPGRMLRQPKANVATLPRPKGTSRRKSVTGAQ